MHVLSRGQKSLFLYGWVFLLAVTPPAQITAQEVTLTNRALKLDGSGSYLELPQNIFTNLNEATVEVWARWAELRMFSRVFEFGAGYQSMSLFNHMTNADLRFNIYPRYAKVDQKSMFTALAKGVLRTNEWIHLAAVSGPDGMKLYANGRLVARHTNTISFSGIHATHTNLLGRGLAGNPTDRDFRGEIDEVRVWDHQRTVAQIRDHMFKRMTGDEDGLTHLWNFDDGTAGDSGPNGHHGKLKGKARIGRVDLDLAPPVIKQPTAPARSLTAAPAPAAAETALTPAPAPVPIHVAVTTPANSNGIVIAIACAVVSLGAVVVFMFLLMRRNHSPAALLSGATPAQLASPEEPAKGPTTAVDERLKEKALADLTDFAKQSLVQGLYTQRAALLEVHQKAQAELAALEARVVALQLPERIAAYEKRIAELEHELTTRNDELRELTLATLHALREKLEEEKKKESAQNRFN